MNLKLQLMPGPYGDWAQCELIDRDIDPGLSDSFDGVLWVSYGSRILPTKRGIGWVRGVDDVGRETIAAMYAEIRLSKEAL